MTVSPSIPTTIEMRPSRLAGVVTTVALVAALITWALLTFTVDPGTGSAQVSVRPTSPSVPSSSPSVERFMKGVGSMAQAQQNAAVLYALGLGPQERQYVQGIISLTPTEQAAAYGRSGTLLDALGLSPRDKQYVQGITSLTQVEQAAAFGGRRGVRFDPALVQFITGIASMAKAQQQAAAGK